MPEWKEWVFKVPTLPPKIYAAAKGIKEAEGCSHWLVVIAGVLALLYLKAKDPKALQKVWVEARKYGQPTGK